nr:Ketol-acid reductoisomerase [Haemophilus influenzae]PRL78510.1 Ketol-acid reductoisomerase [Haemophilus influenzae]
MANYFNTLNLRQKLDQLGRCRFMDREEFADEANFLKGKKNRYRGLWCARFKPRFEYA